jgi:RimJ/RimL family protein N-acetyltransferase
MEFAMNKSSSQNIRSARLDLVLLSPEVLRLSIAHDRETVERILQLSVPPQWYEAQSLIRIRLQQMLDDHEYQPWSLRAISLRDRHVMVGYINFHTKPGAAYLLPFSHHGVEFGYTVFPQYRRHGYAREACLALMKWACADHGVSEFIVSISPENIPSRRLAEGLGFIQVGSHTDEVDGPEDILKLRYLSTSNSSQTTMLMSWIL